MKVSGTATLHAPAERVFAALNDPAVLVRTIPGCEQLEAVGGDRYRMTVTAGVASIKGTYLGDVALTDPVPPSAFTLTANGSGAPGTVRADVRVTLDDQGDGTTLLRYDADAVVGGPVGGVGQRVLTGVAKKTAGEFFDAVNAVLTGTAPEPLPTGPGAAGPEPGAPGAAFPAGGGSGTAGGPRGAGDGSGGVGAGSVGAGGSVAGQVFRRPPSDRPGGVQVTLKDQLPGVLLGAVIALAGVLVGWRLGRSAGAGGPVGGVRAAGGTGRSGRCGRRGH